MKNKIALVTGATSGIGRATAIALAKVGYDIIGCSRRKERLEGLKYERPMNVKFTYFVFDVRDKQAVDQAIDPLTQQRSHIDVLINNAGNAHGLDSIQTGDTDDWDAMM